MTDPKTLTVTTPNASLDLGDEEYSQIIIAAPGVTVKNGIIRNPNRKEN